MTGYAPSPAVRVGERPLRAVRPARRVDPPRPPLLGRAGALRPRRPCTSCRARSPAAYRKPGEIGWWLTLAVLGLAIGEGITGGLLPWDQLGWWARVVEGNIAGLTPVIGGFVQQMISRRHRARRARPRARVHRARPPPAARHRARPLGAPALSPRAAPPPSAEARRRVARRAEHGVVALASSARLFAIAGLRARRAARGAGRPAGRLPGAARVVSHAALPAPEVLPRRAGVLGHVARPGRGRRVPRRSCRGSTSPAARAAGSASASPCVAVFVAARSCSASSRAARDAHDKHFHEGARQGGRAGRRRHRSSP